MIIGKSLLRYFANLPALKITGNFFSKPFAITKMEELYIIVGNPLINQK